MTKKHRLTRRERLFLAGVAIKGVLTGAAHAAFGWLIDVLTN